MVNKTFLRRVLFGRRPRIIGLGVLTVATVLLSTFFIKSPTAYAATADSTINFQARLMSSAGAIVPDGCYNVQFKLYSAATGGSALWTDSYTYASTTAGINGTCLAAGASSDDRLQVINGYVTVPLGSLTAFPATINWNQPLWLTLNIGGTSGSSVSYDGEMAPRLQLTAVPYAFQSGALASTTNSGGFNSTLTLPQPGSGVSSNETFTIPDQGAGGAYTLLTSTAANAGYIQNTTSPQTANFDITGTGTVGTLYTSTIDTPSSGTLTIGGGTNTTQTTIGRTAAPLTLQGSAVTITSAAAATFSTTAGGLTLQAGSGAVSLGTSTSLTASGALGITSGGATALTLDAGGAAALNLGTSNANSVNLAQTGVTSSVNGGVIFVPSTGFSSGTNLATVTASLLTNNSAVPVTATASGLQFNMPTTGIGSAGRIVYITNAGSNSFLLNTGSVVMNFLTTSTATLYWNGTAWSSAGLDAGVTAMGAVDGQAASPTNGATITDNTLYLQSASATAPGLVNISSVGQTFTGPKTFSSAASTGTGLSVNANSLTTGNGASIASTSAVQTAGSLLSVSDTATLATNAGSISGNLVNASRSLTANIAGGSTGTPTLDNGYSNNATTTGNYSINYTIGGGHTNYYLLVSLFDPAYGSSSATLGSSGTPTLTYGGVTLTEIGSGKYGNVSGSNGAYVSYLYGLVNPVVGTSTLSITGNAASYWNVGMTDWYNVNQSTPYGTPVFNFGITPTPVTASHTWPSGHVIVDGAEIYQESLPYCDGSTPNSGQTQAAYNCKLMDAVGDYGGEAMSYKTSTGSATTLGWSYAGNEWADNALDLIGATTGESESVTSPVATYTDSCTMTAGVCSNSSNVMQLQQQYTGATGAVLNIQNAGGGDMIDMSVGGTLVASISNGGNLSVAGGITGGEYNPGVFLDASATSYSHTVTADAFAYNLDSDMGNGGTVSSPATITTTFNITGLPSVDGTMAAFTVTAAKSATTSGSYNHTVIVEINGTTVSTVSAFTSTTTLIKSNTRSFMIVRINGTWTVVGSGLAANPSAASSTVNTADYAEWIDYSGDTAPQPGNVLTIGDGATSVKDAATPYDNHLIGVVSTSPYEVGGADDGHSVILALTGRVPVKVSLENGPIEPGDPLTSSSTPGVAMKATSPGQIIGTALETYDGTQSSNEINVQLHVGYDDPNSDQIQDDDVVSGNLSVGGTATLQSLNVSGDITLAGQLSTATLVVGGTASFSGDVMISGHVVSAQTTAPTIELPTSCGTSPASAITSGSTDSAGSFYVNEGSETVGPCMTVVTFNKAYSAVPKAIILSPDYTLGGTLPTTSTVSVLGAVIAKDTKTFTVELQGAYASSTRYGFDYWVVQ